MVQEDAWHIVQRIQKKRNKYIWSRSISSPDVRNFCCLPSSIVSYHGSALSAVNDTLPKIILHVRNGSLCRRRPRKPQKDNTKNVDRPVIVVVAAHRTRQNPIGNHHSRTICRSTPMIPKPTISLKSAFGIVC